MGKGVSVECRSLSPRAARAGSCLAYFCIFWRGHSVPSSAGSLILGWVGLVAQSWEIKPGSLALFPPLERETRVPHGAVHDSAGQSLPQCQLYGLGGWLANDHSWSHATFSQL